jgi:hypothetical protein
LLPNWVTLCHGRCIYYKNGSNYTTKGIRQKYTP